MTLLPNNLSFTLFGTAGALPLELGVAIAVPLLLSLSAWWAWAARKKRAASLIDDPHQPPVPMDPPFIDRPERGHHSTMDSGLRHIEAGPTKMPEQMVFSGFGDLPGKRCPQCDRNFPGVFEICPFDMTRLDTLQTGPRRRRGRSIPRRFCPECDRRFAPTARFCYHDGTPLATDTLEAASDAPALSVCRECGQESFDQPRCSCDGSSYETIDPGERGFVAPTIPFHRCRQCGHLGTPDQTICPIDGSMMLPEISARLTELPPTAYGPRRKICKKCGSLFGPHTTHCAYDGDELQPLN